MMVINSDTFLLHLAVLLHIFGFSTQFKFPVIKEDENGVFIKQFAVDEHSTCLPVRNCSTFMWMLNNSRKFERFNTNKLLSVFKTKICNIEEAESSNDLTLDTVVACPTGKNATWSDQQNKEDQRQDDDDYAEDVENMMDDEYDDVESIDLRSGGALFERSEYLHTCLGSLEFTHGLRKNPLKTIEIFKISSKWKTIREIKKLKRRHVLRLKSDGNCCWRAYQFKRFRGRYEDIFPGYDELPKIQPKSLKKMSC